MEREQPRDAVPAVPRFFRWIIPVMWMIVLFSAVFCCLIFFLDFSLYRVIGNELEIIIALCCMACCLVAYRFISDRVFLLLSAFAFMSYAFTNTLWFAALEILGANEVFIPVTDLGFFCFFLFLIAAITLEFTDHGISGPSRALVFSLFLVVPVLYSFLFAAGFISLPQNSDLNEFILDVFMLFVYMVLSGLLVVTTIRYRVYRYPVLFLGLSLTCFATFLYCLRETFFTSFPAIVLPAVAGPAHTLTVFQFLSINGPMHVGSFALIIIGLFLYIAKTGKRKDEEPAGA